MNTASKMKFLFNQPGLGLALLQRVNKDASSESSRFNGMSVPCLESLSFSIKC